eukprot:300816_1
MLLFIIIALVIMIPTIMLHYSQHFTLQCGCNKLPTMIENNSSETRQHNARASSTFVVKKHARKVKCCCTLLPVEEDFNFFPISFLYYMIFLVVFYVLMMILHIMDYDTLSFHIIYYESMQWYNTHSITDLHHGHGLHHHTHSTFIYVGDMIIIHGVLLISIWNSLFLFYRYYTMFVSTKSLQEITMISQSHYDSDIGTIDQETNHISQKPAMRIEITRSRRSEAE